MIVPGGGGWGRRFCRWPPCHPVRPTVPKKATSENQNGAETPAPLSKPDLCLVSAAPGADRAAIHVHEVGAGVFADATRLAGGGSAIDLADRT